MEAHESKKELAVLLMHSSFAYEHDHWKDVFSTLYGLPLKNVHARLEEHDG